MPRTPLKKKKKILQSQAFQDWWAARKYLTPLPSDPFRAYMIDLSLRARPLPKDFWKPRTNRSDYPPIDFPRGRVRPKLPSRKELKRKKIKPWKPKPKRPPTKEEKELMTIHEEMSGVYHIPQPELILKERVGWRRSFYRHSLLGGISTVQVGMKKKGTLPPKVALMHEMGHAVHYKAEPELLKSKGIAPPALVGGRGTAETIRGERVAWQLAKPFMKKLKKKGERPVAFWLQRYALGTYLAGAGKVTKFKRTYGD